jgi:MFS family permease
VFDRDEDELNIHTPLFLMALTIFIDFVGFGIILPLLPFWAERRGASPVGIGLVLAIYALAQFIFTPVLGTLSDHYGRRPIILASLLIEALSLALSDWPVHCQSY